MVAGVLATADRTAGSRPPRGFTLIEVLAALALLAITFTVLLKATGASLHLAAHADARTQAALWAQSKLDTAFVLAPPHTGVSRGKFDQRFRWRLDVQPWKPPLQALRTSADNAAITTAATGLHLYKLDLVVSWGSGRQTRNAHFTTLRASRVADDSEGDLP